MSNTIKIKTQHSEQETVNHRTLIELFHNHPIPDNEILANLGLFQTRQQLSRILFMHELYQKIINVHGVIMEFGSRWGQNLALFSAMRGMYEPYNYSRKIIGFDSFCGFPSVDSKDGKSDVIEKGAYSVTDDYKTFLNELMLCHEQESPLAHLQKFALVEGDATQTVPKYLEAHPETIIALTYFDFDLYKPTKECLQAIRPYLTKGSVVAFDELNAEHFPGETVAVREELGLSQFAIQRFPFNSLPSYIVIE